MSYTIDHATYRKDATLPLGSGYSARPSGVWPSSIIIHTTNNAKPTTFAFEAKYLQTSLRVSAHYIIGKAGEIAMILPPTLLAWHAGATLAAWQNARSIGIEHVVSVGEQWTQAQHAALDNLMMTLLVQHRINSVMVETHRRVAVPGPNIRKHDPEGWDDASFYAWRNALGVHTVTAGPHGAIAQEDRRPGALAARYYPPGTPIVCDDLTSSYWHAVDHSGFIPVGQVQA